VHWFIDVNQFDRISCHPVDRKKCRCSAQSGFAIGVFIVSGTNWLEEMVREIESTDAKYTEEEMKERINAEKELQMFPRLEFGDPGVFEVSSY